MSRRSMADVAVGTELPVRSFPVRRVDLVRYCGASGDFNVIHWSDRQARAAGLPDVIAHGMYTMGAAARLVTDWCGDPGAVLSYRVRFSSMVVVPDDEEGASIEVGGRVAEVRPDGTVQVEITARAGGAKVLTNAVAEVRLASSPRG